jgi:hypothetical protein
MKNVYYVLFPLYTGGHHLSNLLSLGSSFNESVRGDYANLKNFYVNNQAPTFHYSMPKFKYDVTNKVIPAAYLDCINSSDIIVGGHLFTLLGQYQLLKEIGNLQILLIDMPVDGESLVRKRISKKLNMTNAVLDAFNVEQLLLYKPDIIQRIFDIPIESVTDISSELFNSRSTIVFSELNNKLNLGLPLDQCTELHNIWMNKLYGT